MKKYILISLILILNTYVCFGITYPKLTGRINDYADILTNSQELELNKMLQTTEAKTTCQVVLLTVKTLQGLSIEEYGINIATKWKLGQKKQDNGLLLLVAPNERKVRFEVGYGLEGVLTDAKTGYLIRNDIIPNFKKGKYYEGIKSGLSKSTGIITNEYDIDKTEVKKYYSNRRRRKGRHSSFGIIVYLVIFVLIRLAGLGGRRRSLIPYLIFGNMTSRSSGRSGGFGGFGGSGGFGGFSGGGGSFGGGGSSGSW